MSASFRTKPFETDNMPTVFLGIRSPFKPDFSVCAAELAYESTLRPHGEFFGALYQPVRFGRSA